MPQPTSKRKKRKTHCIAQSSRSGNTLTYCTIRLCMSCTFFLQLQYQTTESFTSKHFVCTVSEQIICCYIYIYIPKTSEEDNVILHLRLNTKIILYFHFSEPNFPPDCRVKWAWGEFVEVRRRIYTFRHLVRLFISTWEHMRDNQSQNTWRKHGGKGRREKQYDRECLSIFDIRLWASCLLSSVTDLTGPWLHTHIEAGNKKTPFDMAHTGVNLMITSENKLKSTHAVARLCPEVTFHVLVASTCL